MTDPAISYVYLSKGRVLLIGDNLENDEHSHHALQITINLEENSFVLRQGEREWAVQGAIIKPNCPHCVVASDSWRAVILLDAQTEYARQLSKHFIDGIALLTNDDLAFCRALLLDFVGKEQPIDCADHAISTVIERFTGPLQKTESHHPRVAKALTHIHQAQGKQFTLTELAQHVALSESRLSHLFKQEVGIPLQRYLLWYKVAQTAFNIGRGMSLTDAADEAGFADSAHFSRTFRAMFGITPSQILKRSRLVQVISDAS